MAEYNLTSKAVKRAGWVERKVHDPETVASHMYRMAVLTFFANESPTNLNRDRCMKIALVHDMAECIVGDITPADKVDKAEKHRREKDAMIHLRGLVSKGTGDEIYTLWEEYETQSSEEAKFVKDLDKFDMIMQAYEYEQAESRPGDLQDFFNSTQGKFQNPLVQGWVKELNATRANQQTLSTATNISETDQVSNGQNKPLIKDSTGNSNETVPESESQNKKIKLCENEKKS